MFLCNKSQFMQFLIMTRIQIGKEEQICSKSLQNLFVQFLVFEIEYRTRINKP